MNNLEHFKSLYDRILSERRFKNAKEIADFTGIHPSQVQRYRDCDNASNVGKFLEFLDKLGVSLSYNNKEGRCDSERIIPDINEQAINILKNYVKNHCNGDEILAAQRLKIAKSTLRQWLRGERSPKLDILSPAFLGLGVCFTEPKISHIKALEYGLVTKNEYEKLKREIEELKKKQ